MTAARERVNFADRTTERWQPPAFRHPSSRGDRLVARSRRLLDLQAASIWTDLSAELAGAVGVVLDVGAGAQPYRQLVPQEAHYRAIDIEEARERFGYRVPDTEYFSGGSWPVGDDAIDVVLATETLEHVADPSAFLSEARRVLAPGGRVVLTVPFAARWHYVPYDYWRFTPSSLRLLLEAAGFTDVVVVPRGNEVTVAAMKAMALLLAPLAGPRLWPRLATLPLTPLLGPLALAAHRSLRRPGGDDCLGWTATARAV